MKKKAREMGRRSFYWKHWNSTLIFSRYVTTREDKGLTSAHLHKGRGGRNRKYLEIIIRPDWTLGLICRQIKDYQCMRLHRRSRLQRSSSCTPRTSRRQQAGLSSTTTSMRTNTRSLLTWKWMQLRSIADDCRHASRKPPGLVFLTAVAAKPGSG